MNQPQLLGFQNQRFPRIKAEHQWLDAMSLHLSSVKQGGPSGTFFPVKLRICHSLSRQYSPTHRLSQDQSLEIGPGGAFFEGQYWNPRLSDP